MSQSIKGRYGIFGGTYLPEILMPALQNLELHYNQLWNQPEFRQTFFQELSRYAGRPTPLTEVPNFSAAIKGPRIFLKREDLLHTGAHKLNNAIGQCLLAKHAGKKRIIAETGAGQHGVATATACARLGLDCVVFMGAIDMERQKPNVDKMKLLGAKINAVDHGSATLKDAINEALRDWSYSFESTHYCIGSALGPHPYPEIVREFQSVIGIETKNQFNEMFGSLPEALIACVGGGSNAIGMFAPFLEDSVKLIGVEAGGTSIHPGKHAARFLGGSPGILHGSYTYLLQDQHGQVYPTHSISAGLDYPAVGPEHSQLFISKRAQYTSCSDQEALRAMLLLSRSEGIIPALESSHALGYLINNVSSFKSCDKIIINLSGRGDKDLPQLKDYIHELSI